jgi:hypothetical protein
VAHELAAALMRPASSMSMRTPSVIALETGGTMKWVKPKFEFVDLCSEVTSYLFRR